MKRTLEKFPFHILLFPAMTVLIMAVNNLGQIQLDVIWRTLLFSMLPGIGLLLLSWPILRNIRRAGLFSLCFLLFGLTYGHFYEVMEGRFIGNWVIGTHLYMLILWGLLLLIALYLVVFRLKTNKTLTLIVNIVMLVMVCVQVVRITTYTVNDRIISQQSSAEQEATLLQPEDTKHLPDVYYIILDKYARSDVIEEVYGYDNSEFVEGLEELGFFVPKCSRSNYAFTVMSLSSQLNLAFVEDLTDDPCLETTKALIRNNIVHNAFEELGYTTIAFEMGFSWGNMKHFDYYFDEYPGDIDTWSLNSFEILYLKSTIGVLIFEDDAELGAQVTLSDLEKKAERTLLILDVLPEIPSIPGPKFIHAHIISPHKPYVFNADGTLNMDTEEIEDSVGYPEQLRFLEPRVLEVVRQIIETSSTPPIIIIEGDHGFGKEYVTSNFMALYLPDNGAAGLDDHMTMINVFPHIFNTYFGTEVDYMPDICYTHTKDWYESVIQEEWNPACIDD
jgi:hypothetical protein